MLSCSARDALTLAYAFACVCHRVCVCVCDGGEGGGVSEPAPVRVPLEAWLCVFLCGGEEVRWSDVGGCSVSEQHCGLFVHL